MFAFKNGSFGYSIQEFEEVIEALSRKIIDLDFLVTKTIGLDDVQETFESHSKGAMTDIKTIIHL